MIWSFKKLGDLPQQQFVLWENLLEKRTGIQLAQPQHILLQTQVSIRMRELGIENYNEYYDYVNGEVAEWQVLVDRLVVKETTFFRQPITLTNKLVPNKINNAPNSFEATVSYICINIIQYNYI